MDTDAVHYVKTKTRAEHQTGKVYEMNPCSYEGSLAEYVCARGWQ